MKKHKRNWEEENMHYKRLSRFVWDQFCLQIANCTQNIAGIYNQRELCCSFLETTRAIIRLNSRYCSPIVDFR